jgi:hypothetical protein
MNLNFPGLDNDQILGWAQLEDTEGGVQQFVFFGNCKLVLQAL